MRVHKNCITNGDPLETLTCFIGDPSETDIPHRRPTCMIRDQHTCLIRDTLETNMPNRRPTRDRHA